MTETSTRAAPCARTYLFVPGDRPDRFDKAWDSAADAVILDLEDAVAPDRKELARRAVAGWLRPDKAVWVRCNAVDTAWFESDVALAACDGIAGFVLPKAEVVPDAMLQRLRQYRLGLIALIETARGLAHADALAALPQVTRLAFGALDFQVDLGVEGDDDALLYFRSRLVLSSRLAGKPAPIDGVTPAVDDEQALRGDAMRARRLGFGARLCIHPRQIAVTHEVLAPSVEERRWAARVLSAMAASAGAAVAVDGRMVDLPVLRRATAIAQAPAAEERLRR